MQSPLPASRVQLTQVGNSIAVFVVDLRGLNVNVSDVLKTLEEMVRLTPGTREDGDDDFTYFCKKFGLPPDDDKTRRGFEILSAPNSISDAEFSVRLTNCLESAGFTTLLQVLLRHKAELSSLRNFGETTFVELKEGASKFSGLLLQW